MRAPWRQIASHLITCLVTEAASPLAIVRLLAHRGSTTPCASQCRGYAVAGVQVMASRRPRRGSPVRAGPFVEPSIQRGGAILGLLGALDLIAFAMSGLRIVRLMFPTIRQRCHLIHVQIVQGHWLVTERTAPATIAVSRARQDVG